MKIFTPAVLVLISIFFSLGLQGQELSPVWPKPGQVLPSAQVEFMWNPAPDAVSYNLQVFTDEEMTVVLLDIYTEDHFYHWTTNHPGNHYWRIQGVYEDGLTTSWSPVFLFTFFIPSKLPNLILWLDAENVVKNEGKVSQWNDLSGNNFHLTQTNVTNQPRLIANSVFGRPTIEFNGTNNFLTSVFNQTFSAPYSIFTLWTTTTSQRVVLLDNLNMLILDTNNGNDIRAFGGSTLLYPKPSPFNYILTSIDYDAENSRIFENGLLKTSGNLGPGLDLPGLRIGNFSGGGRWFKGELSEVIIFNNVIENENRNSIEQYLFDKYSPPLNIGFDRSLENNFCTVFLNANNNYQSYTWSTGETTPSIEVNEAGLFSLTVTDLWGTEKKDSLFVTGSRPDISLNYSEDLLCINEPIEIYSDKINPELFLFEWNNNQESYKILVSETGFYQVKVTDLEGCFEYSNTIFVDALRHELQLDEEVTLCAGNIIEPLPGLNTEDYIFEWTRSGETEIFSTNSFIEVFESDIYHVSITSPYGCTATDQISVTIIGTAPEVNFEATTACQGTPTMFTDLSLPADQDEIVEWLWDFGDDNTSQEQNPEYLFPEPGTHTVTLLVTAASGCAASLTTDIEVLPTPQAAFTAERACLDLPFQFMDESLPAPQEEIIAWQWDFGDGNVSEETHPVHVFEETGTYTVSLTVTSANGCTSANTQTLEVVGSSFYPDDFTIVHPQSNGFYTPGEIFFQSNTATHAASYILQVAEDEAFSQMVFEGDFQPHLGLTLPLEPGTYFVKVLAYNICLDITESPVVQFSVFEPMQTEGLQLWLDAAHVTLQENRVSAWTDLSGKNHNISQPEENRQPQFIENAINALPALLFDGVNDFLDGGNILNKGLNSRAVFVVAQAGSIGRYISKGRGGNNLNRYGFVKSNNNLTLVYHDNIDRIFSTPFASTEYNLVSTITSRSEAQNSIFINSKLTATNTINPAHDWQSYFNFLVGAYNGSEGYLPPSSYHQGHIAEILIYDRDISTQERFEIESYLRLKYFPDQYVQPVNLGLDKNITYGFCPVILDAGERFESYLWSTEETTQTIEVDKPGIYSVTVTDKYGVESSDEIQVIYPNTKLNDSSPILCLGELREIFPGIPEPEGYTYEWSTGETTHTIQVAEEGIYWVRITDELGCFAYSDTLNLTIDNFAEKINLGEDAELCAGNELSLVQTDPDTEIISFLWNNGENTPSIQVFESGEYSVTLTNENGCTATDEIYVTIIGTAPDVDFEATTACLGTSTVFTDLSLPADQDEIVEWLWDFGDDNTSQEQNPEYLFPEPGTHPVTLLVSAASRCAASLTTDIEVLPTPQAAFTAERACLDLPFQFMDESLPAPQEEIIAWQWDFGDGNVSQETHPVHVFEETGTYTVSLTVTFANECTSATTQTLEVVGSFFYPDDFTIVHPQSNGFYTPGEVFFQSNTATYAANYIIQVAEDEAFSQTVFEGDFQPLQGLTLQMESGTYFVKVVAYNICLDITESPVVQFRVFEPMQTEGLQLWLDAANATLQEDKVSAWTDLSGNNHNISQPEENRQPQLVENAINGLPALLFDGVNDFLDGGDILNKGLNSRAVFVVAQAGNNGRYISKGRGGNNPNRYAFSKSSNNLTLVYHDNIDRIFSTPFASTEYNLVSAITSRSEAQNSIFINSKLAATNTISPTYDWQSDFNFLVGAYNGSEGYLPPSSYHQGHIAEILVYDKDISTQERFEIESYLRLKYFPEQYVQPVNLGLDKNITYGFCPVILDAGERFESYLWSTEETTQTIEVDKPGIYSVTVTDKYGFESSDEIQVIYPNTRLNNSSPVLCLGDVREIFPGIPEPEGYTYEWSTGETTHTIQVAQEGTYWVRITDSQGCFAYSDTLNLTIDYFAEKVSLGEDAELCAGNELSLVQTDPDTEIISFLWSNGESAPFIQVFESGEYSVTLTNENGCTATDEIYVTIIGTIPDVNFEATTACLGTPTVFTDLSLPADQDEIVEWLWDFGDDNTTQEQNPEYLFQESGTHPVSLLVSAASGCAASLTTDIEVLPTPQAAFTSERACLDLPFQFTDESLPAPQEELIAWQWDFGDGNVSHETHPVHVFEETGTFTVSLTVTSANGCTSTTTQTLEVVGSFFSPEDFTMVHPQPNGFYTPGEVFFQSNTATHAGSYILQVAEDEAFNQMVFEGDFQPLHGITLHMEPGAYFVKVLAFNICLDITESPVVQFRVFHPLQTEDLQLWLDAAYVTLLEERVSAWTDLSGNNHSIIQPEENSQPQLVENAINELPALLFDGVNDFLDGGDILDKGLNSRAVFIVAQAEGTGRFIAKARGGTNPNRYGLVKSSDNLNLIYHSTQLRMVSAPFPSTEFNLLTAVTSRQQAQNHLYINSTLAGSNTISPTYDWQSDFNFLVGAYNGSEGYLPPSSYHQGHIAEILIYDRDISTQERFEIESYLRLKYFPEQYVQPVNLGLDKNITYGFCPVILDAGERFQSFLWNTGDTTQILEVTTPGTYKVTVKDIFGFESSDSLEVSFPEYKLSFSDVLLCEGEGVELEFMEEAGSSKVEGGRALRQAQRPDTGERALRQAQRPGTGEGDASTGGIVSSSNYSATKWKVEGQGALRQAQRPDTESFRSPVSGLHYSYLWSTGETTPGIEVSEPGLYSLTLTDTLGCELTLSATVEVDYFKSTATLGEDRSFCMGDTLFVQSEWDPSQLSHLWDDGSTEAGLLIHEPGVYGVMVTNPNGCVAEVSASLGFQGYAPEVDFTAPPECFGEPLRFTGTAGVEESEIVSHLWYFGDPGNEQAEDSGEEVSYTYSEPGIYHATLQVESAAGCRRSLTRAVQVYHLPESYFTPNNACTDVPVNFRDESLDIEGGIGQWQWRFYDEEGVLLEESQEEAPNFIFPTPGSYSTSLTAISVVGCRDSITRAINVRESPEIDFTFTTPCLGDPVFFTEHTTAPPWALVRSQQWDFGDGNHSPQSNPSHLYQQAGIYDVTLQVTAINGCQPSLTRQVTVHAPPQADFVAPDLCVNTPHTFQDLSTVENNTVSQWQWDFNGMGNSTQQNPEFSFSEAGQYSVSLVATSEAGCSNSITQLLDVHPAPEPAFTFFPRYGVAPLTVSFTNTSQGASLYSWDFGDGSEPSSQANPSHTFTQNGIYHTRLMAFTDLGCAEVATQEIKVIPLSIDVAITDVSWQLRNNYLEVSANIMNLGTLEFDTLFLDLQLSGRDPLRETWTGMLRPGEVTSHTFRAQLPWRDSYDYFCVEAHIPRLEEDDNPANNRKCLSFTDDFRLLPPFPNPAAGYVNIGFTLPFEDRITITLSDMRGHDLGTIYDATAPRGITNLRVPLPQLRSGIYIYRVVYREEVKVGRFMVY